MTTRKTIRTLLLTSIFLISTPWLSPTSYADVITFMHSGSSASGSLDGTPFANADFIITAFGDTDNLTSSLPTQLVILHDSASIEIVGVGIFDIVSSTRTYYIDDRDIAGLAKPPVNGGNLFESSSAPALYGWDMLTSIGPIHVQHSLLGWSFIEVITSGGRLEFNDATVEGTSQATVVVPEPIFADGFE